MKLSLLIVGFALALVTSPHSAQASDLALEQQSACRSVTWPLGGRRSLCLNISKERGLNKAQIEACGQRPNSRQFELCLGLVNDPDNVPKCFQKTFGAYDISSGNNFFASISLLGCLDPTRYEEAQNAWIEYLCFVVGPGKDPRCDRKESPVVEQCNKKYSMASDDWWHCMHQ